MERTPVAPQQSDHGLPDGIRPEGRSGRKHAVRAIVGRWGPHEFIVAAAIEDPQHVEVREPFDIEKPFLEFLVDLDRALGLMPRAAAKSACGSR